MGLRHRWFIAALVTSVSLTIPACSQAIRSLPDAYQRSATARYPHALPTSHGKWYVDGVHGSNRNDCMSPARACKTITHAISLILPGDTIFVAPAIYRENIVDPPSMEIVGAATATTILDGGGQGSVITSTLTTSTITISNVTLYHGGGNGDGGGIYHCTGTMTLLNSVITGGNVVGGRGPNGYGGAIYNCPGSILTIVDTSITNNTGNAGGGICNGGALTILDSTFSGNTARRYNGGGAIFNYGVLTIGNSTISGNRALHGVGGGIDNGFLVGGTGRLAINSSTITDNSAGAFQGGGLYNLHNVPEFLANTIIANNTGGNCSGFLFSRGYNLISDSTCHLHGPGDRNSVDPKLGPLQNNGGPTQTMALLEGSPAIDAGNPHGCTSGPIRLKTDQRGFPRPDKEDRNGCDIGAYERQSD